MKVLGWDSYVTKSHSDIRVLRSQLGLSQDQLFLLFLSPCGSIAMVKRLRYHRSKRSLGLLYLPMLELQCTNARGWRGRYPTVARSAKLWRPVYWQEVWRSDRKKGLTLLLRGSFEMEKAERTRAKRRGEEWETDWLTERVSVRKAQWLVGNL